MSVVLAVEVAIVIVHALRSEDNENRVSGNQDLGTSITLQALQDIRITHSVFMQVLGSRRLVCC